MASPIAALLSLRLLMAPPATAEPEVPPATEELFPPEPVSNTAPEPAAARFPSCAESRWACCPPGQPCIRSHFARTILALTGVAGASIGLGLFLIVGDRLKSGDPAGVIAGAGGTAFVGALTGGFAALMSRDRAGHWDRLRPSTAAGQFDLAGREVTDEVDPASLSFRFAPNWYFPNDGGRLRLFGHVGGMLGTNTSVDPRPQAGSDGSFESALDERRFSLGLGFDMATYLPYPVRARSPHLGPAELRWKPEVQVRRQTFQPGTAEERLVERTMFLPLTAGVRWNLSRRQRFTFYTGPRFDFTAFSDLGGGPLRRGAAQLGPFYGEAWYDIDVPFGRGRKATGRGTIVNGQLTMGYIHSRFDGRGLNLGGAVGFMGPIHAAWRMRFRPRGSKVAAQAGVGTWIGSGVSVFADLGIVLPDIGRRTP